MSESEFTEFENLQNNGNNGLFSASHLVFILEILIQITNSHFLIAEQTFGYTWMIPLNFEWDENKNVLNQKKHGVSFEEAKTVFTDESARLISDPEHSEGEERFILMGISIQLRILVVCHCERNSNTIRLISARKANKHERKQYEGFYHA